MDRKALAEELQKILPEFLTALDTRDSEANEWYLTDREAGEKIVEDDLIPWLLTGEMPEAG